jgi:serine/threonine protein kinase/tetratricopeptide (TPR) repeat protein
MAFSNDRDRRLGIQILQQELLTREQLASAFSDPRRSEQFDLCHALQQQGLLSSNQAAQIRERIGLPVSSAHSGSGRESKTSLDSGPVSLRKQSNELYKQVQQTDPYYCPHADTVFERIEKLGEGGMGVVYRVRDQRLGRHAALKLIHPNRRSDRIIQRFRRESRVTAALDHPSIPPVYEAGTNAAGESYLLMRVIEGSTLESCIQSYQEDRQQRELQVLLRALIKVCEAIAYAHSRKIVHRDLKPDNVMVGEFGQVMVMDWGLALELDKREGEQDDDDSQEAEKPLALTAEGASLGTPGYMSPEQAGGEPVDTRTDIFALGALLTKVLTGQCPIQGKSQTAVIIATIENNIAKPSDILSDVPRELCSIAVRALAFQAEDRYQSADEMATDLRNYLTRESVMAHDYSVSERLVAWPRRHPGLLVVIILASLFATVAGVLWAELSLSRSSQRLSEALLEKARREDVQATQLAKEKKAALAAARQKIELEKRVRQLAEKSQTNAERAKEAAESASKRIIETLKLISEARVLVLRGADFKTLETRTKKALAIAGANFSLYMTIAQIYDSGQHHRQAKELLEQAVQLYPPAYDALFYLHRLEIRGDVGGHFRLTTPLKRLWRAAQARGDENEFTLFTEACTAERQGLLDKAQKLYSKIEKYSTTFTWAYINRGVLRYRTGQKNKALEDFNRVLELDPGLSKVYNNRGFIRYELEDYQGAVSDFDRALKLDPKMALAYGNRAMAKAKLRLSEEAFRDARRAIELAPRSSQTHGAMGTVLRILGRKQDALKSYNRALVLNPRFTRALRRRAQTRFELNDKRGALEDYQRFLKIAPQSPETSIIRAKIKECKDALEAD